MVIPLLLCDFRLVLIAKLSMKSLADLSTDSDQGCIFNLFKSLLGSATVDHFDFVKPNYTFSYGVVVRITRLPTDGLKPCLHSRFE